MAWEIWVPPVLAGIITAVLVIFATGWKLSGRLGRIESRLDDLGKGLEDAKEDRKVIREEIARGLEDAKKDRKAIREEFARGMEDAKKDRKAIREEIARGMRNAKDERDALERRTREDVRAVSEAVERLTLALAFRGLTEPRERQRKDRTAKSTAQG